MPLRLHRSSAGATTDSLMPSSMGIRPRVMSFCISTGFAFLTLPFPPELIIIYERFHFAGSRGGRLVCALSGSKRYDVRNQGIKSYSKWQEYFSHKGTKKISKLTG
jgi:hypothetical protein